MPQEYQHYVELLVVITVSLYSTWYWWTLWKCFYQCFLFSILWCLSSLSWFVFQLWSSCSRIVFRINYKTIFSESKCLIWCFTCSCCAYTNIRNETKFTFIGDSNSMYVQIISTKWMPAVLFCKIFIFTHVCKNSCHWNYFPQGATEGLFKTFNFDNNIHLANQNQVICFR